MLKSQLLLLVMTGAPSAAASPMVANVERARLPRLLLPSQRKRRSARKSEKKPGSTTIPFWEPVLKEAKKACKSPYASQALKDEKGAAETLVKEANGIVKKTQDYNSRGQKLDAYSQEIDCVKELAKNLTAKAGALTKVDGVLKGIDDEALAKLKDAVNYRASAVDKD